MNRIMQQLAIIRDRGVISEISYQFCEFIKRVDPDCPDEVLLAACLAVTGNEEGDVCVELKQEADRMLFKDGEDSGIRSPLLNEWVEKCRASSCVGLPGESRPLIIDRANRLYLHRYWKYEQKVAEELLAKAKPEEGIENERELRKQLQDLFPSKGETDWQKVAAFVALKKKLAIISGGPGTGKTSTVVKILLLLARSGMLRHAALAAPTGKAAARLKESVTEASEQFQTGLTGRKLPPEAFTIHKLLGARKHASEYRYNRENPLPYDTVVIDEASMVDLALMYRLLEALPRQSRLILLGDKDQLSSVEAGAILGSICPTGQNRLSQSFIAHSKAVGLSVPDSCLDENPKPLTDHIILLKKSYRFGENSGIGHLALKILDGDPDGAAAILRDEKFPDVEFITYPDSAGFKNVISGFYKRHFMVRDETLPVKEALSLLSRLGILCVHRRGLLGSEQVNHLIEHQLREQKLIPATSEWYAGKPVMITQNDYSLGLRNGDLGMALKDEKGELKVFFPGDQNTHRSFYPSRLSSAETAYAMTVHKSQGSEFDDVAVILPQQISAISTKELLYTAVTRARRNCSIIGSEAVLYGTIEKKADRSSGLRDRLWGDLSMSEDNR